MKFASTGCARWARLCSLFAAAGLMAAAAVWAVPPPPPRPDTVLDVQLDGPEQVVRDTVRAYQPVPVVFHAKGGDRLLLRLVDAEPVLMLGIEAPSGQIWMIGARPGPDGMELRLLEAGRYRLLVALSADAARAGRAVPFDLGIRLRRAT